MFNSIICFKQVSRPKLCDILLETMCYGPLAIHFTVCKYNFNLCYNTVWFLCARSWDQWELQSCPPAPSHTQTSFPFFLLPIFFFFLGSTEEDLNSDKKKRKQGKIILKIKKKKQQQQSPLLSSPLWWGASHRGRLRRLQEEHRLWIWFEHHDPPPPLLPPPSWQVSQQTRGRGLARRSEVASGAQKAPRHSTYDWL